ncbi:MAG: threonine ammonia-lyase, biosynthetic [Hyphomicrobiaceae bacterium]|nr:threonine ammonia-lyase, biosynthetic [Hyphomicrobiaceae bacterium]
MQPDTSSGQAGRDGEQSPHGAGVDGRGHASDARHNAGGSRDPAWWLREILTARVYDVARHTPLDAAPLLSRRLDNSVWLKREDLQPVFSFKLRGAYNRLTKLDADERGRGVVAVSAGNHAQGVAFGARELGIDAVIVMPVTTPRIKTAAVAAYGARIELIGDSYSEAAAFGQALAIKEQRVLIHPFDDAAVIAGQGTVALELLADHKGRLDAVFVPVGGGGLCAGIAVYLKTLDPSIRIVAVEPDDAACLEAAMHAGQPVALDHVGLFVDGCAVRQIGDVTFEVLRGRVDDIVTVGVDQVCAAIRDVFEETRSIVEPAGALALAGMKKWVADTGARRQNLAVVLSGANMNFDRLGHVTERAEIGEQHEALFGVTIPEKAGSFFDFCRALGRRSITEFNYRTRGGAAAEVFVGVQLTGGQSERTEIRDMLTGAGYVVADFTRNEVARLHVRHMVGGPRSGVAHERMLRFEFPERPGALLYFLETLGTTWDITLFHYRNRGAAYGRVLAGFAVAPRQEPAFMADVAKLGFWFADESDNEALQQFLS